MFTLRCANHELQHSAILQDTSNVARRLGFENKIPDTANFIGKMVTGHFLLALLIWTS